ncbi:P-loop containing nucleoside triphosphate hydrolase protein [Xylaria intraflava]|nr:P-loop containing nucleoside triphosphate hydrolase protein [Xylaria intraflava]
MGERKRPALLGKTSADWNKKINTHLFKQHDGDRKQENGTKDGPVERWNPHNELTQEDAHRFYSGYKHIDEVCCCLKHREKFARFSIGGVLANHPEDDFKIASRILDSVPVTSQAESDSFDDLAKAIRADGQRDVDAEIPKDISARISKGDGIESARNMSSEVQSVITAGSHTLGPPLNPCAIYLRLTKCGEYGRSKSTVWKSPYLPNLDYKDGRKGLLDHQVTAIVWLLSRLVGDLPKLKSKHGVTGKQYTDIETSLEEDNRVRLKGPKYFGGILADSMGLGKTLTTVALIELLIRQKLHVLQVDGTTKHRPILLIVPNATVGNQWIKELCQIDKHVLRQIVTSGPGLEISDSETPERVIHLEREHLKKWPAAINYMWDVNNRRASKVILVVTMESWASRTCDRTTDGEWTSSFTNAGRGFSLVIVDEAYKVKNHETKNWRSVYLLERQFTLLITATPYMNTITDLFGLARLLWSVPERYLKQSSTWKEIERKFQKLDHLRLLDDYPLSHDFQLVAGRHGFLAQLLHKPRNSRTPDIALIREHLRHFETLSMLKRSPSSNIYADWDKKKTISLEGIFPKAEHYTVEIDAGNAYDQEYQKAHIPLLIEYLRNLKDWGGLRIKRSKKKQLSNSKKEEEVKSSIMSSIRVFQIAASSLDAYDLDQILEANGHSTLAPSVAKMRDNMVDLPRLARFLVRPHEKGPQTHAGYMRLATRNSPVLRYILSYIKKHILTRHQEKPIKKLMIIEQNVMLAFYYELVLQFLGLNCRCMHAQLPLDERQSLIDSFNSSDNESCQILIQLYSVGFAGTNLHKSCSRVLVASQSHSLQVQWQAIHRVIRVGQTSDVVVHRVKLHNSFHAFRESRQVEKMLPELGTRDQGETKKLLVKLLNVFQYEVCEAWNSHEGQKLLKEMNLLDEETDEELDEEANTPKPKKPKLEDGVEAIANKSAAKDAHTPNHKTKMDIRDGRNGKAIQTEGLNTSEDMILIGVKSVDNVVKREELTTLVSHMVKAEPGLCESFTIKAGKQNAIFTTRTISKTSDQTNADPSSGTKRKRKAVTPKSGNGSGGWYNTTASKLTDSQAFLKLRTRDAYYQEFVRLPRDAKGFFSHEKNSLRRLLSYGNDNGILSTRVWNEEDLDKPAILERALELMLRVRLGANGIAMLPFPTVDLSRAPPSQRKALQNLLAGMVTIDQDLDKPDPAGKNLRESICKVNLDNPVSWIEEELETRARFGYLKGSIKQSNNAGGAVGGPAREDGNEDKNTDGTFQAESKVIAAEEDEKTRELAAELADLNEELSDSDTGIWELDSELDESECEGERSHTYKLPYSWES